jgi:hypothetical protein
MFPSVIERNNMDNDKTVLGKMETVKHIHAVREFIYAMIEELDKRAREHDQSKLESPEAEMFLSDMPPKPDTKSDRTRYRENLCVVTLMSGGPIHATAAQRAEAFLITVGKWEE